MNRRVKIRFLATTREDLDRLISTHVQGRKVLKIELQYSPDKFGMNLATVVTEQ